MCWFWTRYDNVFASYTIPPPWNDVGSWDLSIMTSSNGIIFHVTGHLWGESTGDRGVFRSQRPVTRNFDALADLRLNKRFSKHSRCRWFETPSRSLWRRCNVHGKEGCTYSIQSIHWPHCVSRASTATVVNIFPRIFRLQHQWPILLRKLTQV